MSDYRMLEVQVSQVEPLTEQVKRSALVVTTRWQTIACQFLPEEVTSLCR